MRPLEMKKILGVATNFGILSPTMVGQWGKLFISNGLKGYKNLIFARDG